VSFSPKNQKLYFGTIMESFILVDGKENKMDQEKKQGKE
jgi:hypothetical protein